MKLLGIDLKNKKIQNHQVIEPFFFINNKEELLDMFESIENDFPSCPSDERPQRATGFALEIALDLI